MTFVDRDSILYQGREAFRPKKATTLPDAAEVAAQEKAHREHMGRLYLVYSRVYDGKPCYLSVKSFEDAMAKARKMKASKQGNALLIVNGYGEVFCEAIDMKAALKEAATLVPRGGRMEVGSDID